jgi:N-acetylglucosaminyldiphosphoundecaprenol N-acetyl-beta-D-mannosaminyltransferase
MDTIGFEEAVASICRAAKAGVRGYVVTPNVDHVVLYRQDAAFRAACDGAALRLPDGVPLVAAARLLGAPLLGRIAGADLVPALCAAAAALGCSVFLLGGRRGVAEQAAARLTARFPGLDVAGTYTPPDGFGEDAGFTEAAIQAVNRGHAAILFAALGTPKQEIWVHRHWERLQVPVAVCCGAALDYAAGVKVRAPRWMQRAGLEWLWRLALEPGRLWKRYLVRDAAFVGIFLKEWWSARNRVSER